MFHFSLRVREDVDFDCEHDQVHAQALPGMREAEINFPVSHNVLIQASRLLGPALINRNLPALGCPVFSPNVLAINRKSTIAVAREEKPSIFKKFVKKIYDSTNSVSTKIIFCIFCYIIIESMQILELYKIIF